MVEPQVISISALAWLCLCSPLEAQPPAPQSRPPKQTLNFSIPEVQSAADPAPAAKCTVSFGPSILISAVAFSPDSKTLAVGGYREVLLWDLAGAKLAKRIGTGQLDGLVHAVAFVDGEGTLAVGDGVPHQSGAVKIFNCQTGEPIVTFDEPKRVVYCLATSPDGILLAAGDADSLVHVWNLNTKKLAKTIDAHNGWVLGAAFSSDGKRLATASADQTLRVWNVDTWEPAVRYDLPATVHGAAISPDGKIVVGAVGGPGEWALRIGRIDFDPQQAARRKPEPRPISTGTGMPLDVVWPARGEYVFVPCNDHTVRVYQGNNGRLVKTLDGHTDWVYCMAASPDGKCLASGSADGTVKLWNGADGKPLATLVQLSPGTDDWLIMTPQGYFTTSSPEALTWKAAGSPAPAEQFAKRYQNTELVLKAMTPSDAPPTAWQRNGKSPRRGQFGRAGKKKRQAAGGRRQAAGRGNENRKNKNRSKP